MGRASAASLALALAACNAVFGVEGGKPRPLGPGGAGGSGSGGDTGGAGGSGGGAGGAGGVPGQQCGTALGGLHTGALRWAKKSTSSLVSIATSVAFGASDDVIAAGMYRWGPMQIGASMLPYAGMGDEWDIFLASYGRQDGKPKWAKGFPAALSKTVNDVDVDRKSGDIVITGKFEGSVSFDGDKTTLKSAGMTDIFVARFTKDGDPLWNLRLGDASDYQAGISVAVDGSGAVVLGALVYGTIEFGGKTSGIPGTLGLFLGKLDASGKDLWSWFYPISILNGETIGFDRETIGLDADDEGNIVMTAWAIDTSFDSFDSTDAYKGETDVVVIKYDKEGKILWSRMFGGTMPPEQNGQQWGTAAAFDCTGDVYLTGAFKQDIVFGELPTLTTADPTDDADIFLVRLRDKDGEPLWAKAFGDYGFQRSLSVDSDADSNVVIGGILIDDAKSVGIDFGSGQKHLPPGGPDYLEDFFLAKLSPSGDFAWSHRFGDQYIQEGEIAVDPTGLIASAGYFVNEIEFELTPDGQLVDNDQQYEMFVTVFEH